MKKLMLISAIAALFCSFASAQPTALPRDITTDTTLTNDQEWLLAGYTFVNPGVTLTIEPGTVIRGAASGGAAASALIVMRGAMIDAVGTPEAPIIFTSENDPLDGSWDETFTETWGGVIVLGAATINSRADGSIVAKPITDKVEGVELGEDEIEKIDFGGTNDEDNSGRLKYVSIRHAGEDLGAGNEINGLTLGGVGSETEISFIEVFANKDDGIELFGGTVSLRNVAMLFGGDDGLDFDQGWRGNVQYMVIMSIDGQTAADAGRDASDKGGEHDGATNPLTETPLGMAYIANATLVGAADENFPSQALNIRDNAGVWYVNSIFTEWTEMLNIESDNTDRFNSGDVDFFNNIWWADTGLAANPSALSVGAVDASAYFGGKNFNAYQNPNLEDSVYVDDGADLRPIFEGNAVTTPRFDVTTLPDASFFEVTPFKGAQSRDYSWLSGWTLAFELGYLKAVPTWVETAGLGWIYSYNGTLENTWIYIQNINRYAYLYNIDKNGAVVWILPFGV